ncbi:hypothetical protein PAMA_001360 [Pampus argenteus]
MDSAVTFIILLGSVWSVSSLPTGQSVSFSVVFSDGTRLLVEVRETADSDEDDARLHYDDETGFDPTVQIMSSVPLSPDPGSPHLLVCVLSGFNSPLLDVLWWVDDTLVSSADAKASWMRSEWSKGYSTTSVWEVSAADWRSTSTYWCGTIQEGRVYRQKLCYETDG